MGEVERRCGQLASAQWGIITRTSKGEAEASGVAAARANNRVRYRDRVR